METSYFLIIPLLLTCWYFPLSLMNFYLCIRLWISIIKTVYSTMDSSAPYSLQSSQDLLEFHSVILLLPSPTCKYGRCPVLFIGNRQIRACWAFVVTCMETEWSTLYLLIGGSQQRLNRAILGLSVSSLIEQASGFLANVD